MLTPDILHAGLRALGFVAVLQAGGAALFVAVFGGHLEASREPIIRLVRYAVPTAVVLLLAQYLLEPARMAGTLSGVFDAELHGFTLRTRVALVTGLRLAGLLVIACALLGSGAGLRRYGIAGAVLIAMSFPMVGHSAEDPARLWLMPLLGLHLLVVEFWYGALLPLIYVAERESAAMAARVVDRFSRLATWLVPLIFVAGLLIAARLLPNFAALRTPYGVGVLLKLVLFLLLMGLATLNKWRLGPALAREGQGARRRLRRSIGIEFTVISAVLAGTAVLTMLWSPGS